MLLSLITSILILAQDNEAFSALAVPRAVAFGQDTAGALLHRMETIQLLARKSDPFARIPKTILNDERLSWKAKGILCYLLGKPPGWKLRPRDIELRGKDGRDSVRSALNELREEGYAELVQLAGVNGQFGEWVWKVSDSRIFAPDTGFPEAVNPRADYPDAENPYYSKTDFSKNESYQERMSPPSDTYWEDDDAFGFGDITEGMENLDL